MLATNITRKHSSATVDAKEAETRDADAVTVAANTEGSSITASATTDTEGWDSPKLFINNSAGAFDEVGFAAKPDESVTSTGFRVFGSMLVWAESSGDVVTKWYAERVDNDLWVLKWNVDNESMDPAVAVPVVLKNRRGGPPGRRG